MAGLRMFSYLPNPRLWKATIAARFCGVEVEVRGASPKALRDWLWDYDARPLAEQERRSLSSLARTGRVGLTSAKLFKTDAFLEAQPFGNVPAGFGRMQRRSGGSCRKGAHSVIRRGQRHCAISVAVGQRAG